ncbi:MAG TPA: hypothetical protein VFR49_06555, partial [Solirubrobacteraceae bacterium]|nr:hypothetical protein [Solirubrobacteraceae bacterium]
MIRRPQQIALLLALVTGLAVLAPAASAARPPAAIPLARGWEFLPDPGNTGLAGRWQLGQAGRGWRAVTVPHVFDPRPLPSLFAGTVAWYRLRFPTPATPGGFAWAVRFEQSRRITRVWLNGHYIGGHDDPYTPFQLDLGSLAAGATNTLVVRVDNRKGIEPREGWWNWGGI